MDTQPLVIRSFVSGAIGLTVGLLFFLLAGFTEIQSRLSEVQAAISPLGELSLTASKAPYILAAVLTAIVFVAGAVALLRAIDSHPREAVLGSIAALLVFAVLGIVGALYGIPTRVTLRDFLPWGVMDVLYAAAGSTVIYVAAATCVAGIFRGMQKRRQQKTAQPLTSANAHENVV